MDLPIGTDAKSNYNRGCSGLLNKVVLSVMLDGTLNARGSGGVEGDSISSEKNDTQNQKIAGTRSVLLQLILQSDQLTTVWEEGLSSSKNDHIPVMIQVGNERAG